MLCISNVYIDILYSAQWPKGGWVGVELFFKLTKGGIFIYEYMYSNTTVLVLILLFSLIIYLIE